ncbi:hypothetical protein Clacol_003499 [Clathrus columnatus]|uniref:Uncharacterized protein n=1 Tax=Clathrus columnatus TaxID=1419009 RepID=A0AAV5A6I6_9AGAM|nr:hypothetical protein Clacol_003499 [Clathrus columnatus]
MHINTRLRCPLPPIPYNIAEKSEATIFDSDYPIQNNLTEPIPLTEEDGTYEAMLPPLYADLSLPSFHTITASDNVVEEANAEAAVNLKSRQWHHTITQSKTRLLLAIFFLVLGICGIIFGIMEGTKIDPRSKDENVQLVTTTRTLEPQTRDIPLWHTQSLNTVTVMSSATPEPSQVTATAPLAVPMSVVTDTTITLEPPQVTVITTVEPSQVTIITSTAESSQIINTTNPVKIKSSGPAIPSPDFDQRLPPHACQLFSDSVHMHTHTRSRPLPPIPRIISGKNNLTEPILPLTQIPEQNHTDEATLPTLSTISSPPSFQTNVASDNVEEANAVAVTSEPRQWYHSITRTKAGFFLITLIWVLGAAGILSGFYEVFKSTQ